MPVTSYDVRYILTGADEMVDPNWTVVDPATSGEFTYTVTGLADDSPYDVQVKAVNTSGDGPWSASGSPAVQVSITASPASPVPGTSVTLTAVIRFSSDEGSPTYRWELDLGNWSSVGTGSTFSYLIGHAGSERFRVTATYSSDVIEIPEP